MSEVKIDIETELHRTREDLDSINKKLDQLTNKAGKADSKLQKMGDRAVAVGKKMSLFVTVPILAAAGAAIKLGMDAVESRNLFEVSMGAMTAAADKWSANLSDKLGINRYESQKMIGTFNVMLKSMGHNEKAAYDMSKGLANLTYDMASFYNLEAEDAFLKLQAGITGEIEPLKRLGIVIKEATIKTWALKNGMIEEGQVLTENQKITARYNVILEQTSLAQGDLERTLDSPANKLRVLKSRITETATEIGIRLLPTFEKLLGHIEKMVKWFSDLSDANKKQITTLMGIAAAAGPVILTFGKIIKLAPKLKVAFTAMTGPIGVVIVAAAALGAALDSIIDKSIEKSDAAMDAMVDEKKTASEYWAFRTKLIEEEILSTEEYKELYEKHGRDYKRVMVAMVNLPEYAHLKKAWEEMSEKVKEESGEIVETILTDAEIIKQYRREIFGPEELIKMPEYEIPKIVESPEDLLDKMGLTGFDETFNAEWDASMFNSEQRSQDWLNKQLEFVGVYGAQKKSVFDQATKDEMSFADQAMAVGSALAGHSQAVSLAMAIVNTAAGATKALEAYPPPLSLIMAAIQVAAGMKQVQVISSQTIPSAAEGGILPRDMMVQAHKEELIAPQPMLREIFREVIREKEMSPIIVRVYIGADQLDDHFVDVIQSRAETGDLEISGKAID